MVLHFALNNHIARNSLRELLFTEEVVYLFTDLFYLGIDLRTRQVATKITFKQYILQKDNRLLRAHLLHEQKNECCFVTVHENCIQIYQNNVIISYRQAIKGLSAALFKKDLVCKSFRNDVEAIVLDLINKRISNVLFHNQSIIREIRCPEAVSDM